MTLRRDECLHLGGALKDTATQPTQPNNPGLKNQNPTPHLQTPFLTCMPSPPVVSPSLKWIK